MLLVIVTSCPYRFVVTEQTYNPQSLRSTELKTRVPLLKMDVCCVDCPVSMTFFPLFFHMTVSSLKTSNSSHGNSVRWPSLATS